MRNPAARSPTVSVAGLVLFGSVTPSGSEVRVQADLFDVTSGERVASVDLSEAADRMDRLADDTAVDLLRQLSGTRTLGATRRMSIGTSSLRALRAFLTGEQHYRRSEMDSAQVEYEHAAGIDTAFGLAYNRLGIVNGWLHGAADSSSINNRLRAGRFTAGLVPRDSLLLMGDSAFGAALLASTDTATARLGKRAVAMLREAAERYPDDPQVWYSLGDAKLHLPSAAQVMAAEMLGDFQRAVALDSLFAPAYIHAIELAVVERDTVLAHRLAARFLTLSRHGSESEHLEALSQWLQTGTEKLDTTAMTGNAAHLLAQALPFYPDSIESGVLVSRVFLRHRQAIGASDSHARHHVASALAVRGRLREAAAVGVLTPDFVAEFSILDAYPVDSIDAVVATWTAGPVSAARLAFGWWGHRRDSAAIRNHLTRLESSRGQDREDTEVAESILLGRLLLSVIKGDDSAAARLANEYRPTSCLRACDGPHLILGRFFAESGDLAQAARWLSPPHHTVVPPLTTAFALERGRIAERRGSEALARREFEYVVGMWRGADPTLAPLVAEARAALARLSKR
jgi:tetratricopeptide (TPR) repeat protein